MEVDRRAFLATVGSAAAVEALPREARAEALEHYMSDVLDEQAMGNELKIRRGTGSLFAESGRTLEPMPATPTLVDFFTLRFGPATHVLQSASDARKKGEKEETSIPYMEARMITVHDLYAFEPGMKVPLDPFIDVIGRNFKQSKEGLGFDNSPVAHMWRSMMFPDHPL